MDEERKEPMVDNGSVGDDEPAISVHALSRLHNPQTMSFKGQLCRGFLTFLVDTCSTHNFINRVKANRLGLKAWDSDVQGYSSRWGSYWVCKCLLWGSIWNLREPFHEWFLFAYKLGFPSSSRIHPIFMFLFWKRLLVLRNLLSHDLTDNFNVQEDNLALLPAALDRRNFWGRDQVFIHWQGLFPAEATWDRGCYSNFFTISFPSPWGQGGF